MRECESARREKSRPRSSHDSANRARPRWLEISGRSESARSRASFDRSLRHTSHGLVLRAAKTVPRIKESELPVPLTLYPVVCDSRGGLRRRQVLNLGLSPLSGTARYSVTIVTYPLCRVYPRRTPRSRPRSATQRAAVTPLAVKGQPCRSLMPRRSRPYFAGRAAALDTVQRLSTKGHGRIGAHPSASAREVRTCSAAKRRFPGEAAPTRSASLVRVSVPAPSCATRAGSRRATSHLLGSAHGRPRS